MKITPTQKRILGMPYDLLIGHYQLIEKKASNLSSNERRLVSNRIKYLLSSGKITKDEINDEPLINP